MSKKIYYVYGCWIGEVQGFFDEEFNCIASWCCNDAMWDCEYMNGFINALGYEVDISKEDDKDLIKALYTSLGLGEPDAEDEYDD